MSKRQWRRLAEERYWANVHLHAIQGKNRFALRREMAFDRVFEEYAQIVDKEMQDAGQGCYIGSWNFILDKFAYVRRGARRRSPTHTNAELEVTSPLQNCAVRRSHEREPSRQGLLANPS